jgi:WD40 repeat protein
LGPEDGGLFSRPLIYPSAVSTLPHRLAVLFVALAVFPAYAQGPPVRGGTQLDRFVRPDGTVDLDTAPAGPVDLSGFTVEAGSQGLRAQRSAPGGTDGTYVDVGTGPDGTGINGSVRAVAVSPDGTFYVGGFFTLAGDQDATNVARWNGTSWETLGSGVGADQSESVTGLAFGPSGDLYAVGGFTTAGGAPASRVARWDGAAWSAVGSGLNAYLNAVAVGPDGVVYVGGVSSTHRGAVARWDGTAWSGLGFDTGSDLDGSVIALAVGPDGTLYIGGAFTDGGGSDYVTSWTEQGGLAPLDFGMNGPVLALVIGPDGALYAGGGFTTAGGGISSSPGVPAAHVARWDGTEWGALGGGVDGTVTALAVGPNGDVYAGGYFGTAGGAAARNVAKWDGTTWGALGTGPDSGVETLAVSPDGSVLAGGSFESAGDTPTQAVARWDGTEWEGYGSAVSRPVQALTVGPDGAVYVGGGFQTAGGVIARRVARWDGTSWSPLGAGIDATYGEVLDLAFGPDGSLYAGGSFGTDDGEPAPLVARWDGTSWSAVGQAPPVAPGGQVQALAVGPDGALYAGGFSPAPSGLPYPSYVLARRDGASWTTLAAGPFDGTISAVLDLAFGPDGALYVGGRFESIGGVTARGLARWDGATWSPLGSGLGGEFVNVRALAVGTDGGLYAGGLFETAGGVPAGNVARWDGAAWSALGSGTAGASSTGGLVYDLDVGPDGTLSAGGVFTTAGGAPAARVARWDGSAWSGVGAGVDGTVFAVATDAEGDLYLGGSFTRAGAVRSPNLVLFEFGPVADEPPAGPSPRLALAVSPNPASGSATLRITTSAGGPAEAALYDALGRRVRALYSGTPNPDTPVEVTVDASSLAPGVYVARVTGGPVTVTKRFTVVR